MTSSLPTRLAALLLGLMTASPAAAETPQLPFQFQHHGTPAVHRFVLKWSDPAGNLQAIDVFTAETNELLQTIPIPQETVHLIYQDLQGSKPDRIRDAVVDNLDYNFDNYADLRLTRNWPYRVGDKFYLVWTFNKDKNQYEKSEQLSSLPNSRVNAKTARVESTTLKDYGGGEYVKTEYTIAADGKLTLHTRITQTMQDKVRLTFRREVRTRLHGELQRVCKIDIPGEGRPHLTWGHRGICRPFMTKG